MAWARTTATSSLVRPSTDIPIQIPSGSITSSRGVNGARKVGARIVFLSLALLTEFSVRPIPPRITAFQGRPRPPSIVVMGRVLRCVGHCIFGTHPLSEAAAAMNLLTLFPASRSKLPYPSRGNLQYLRPQLLCKGRRRRTRLPLQPEGDNLPLAT